jgi:hypothetical protein
MRNKRTLLVSTLLVGALSLFGGTSTSVAAAQSQGAQQSAAVADFLTKVEDSASYEDVTGAEAADLAALAASDINSTGTHLTQGAVLDYSAQRIQKTPAGVYAVSIPIVGGGVAHASSVTAVYTASKMRAGVIEMQFHEISSNSGRVQFWADGEQRYDEVVTAENPEPSQTQSRGMNWQNLNVCLGKLGIPAWIAAGISNVCALACLITAGAGCVICVAGVIGFSGGSVAFCVKQAWNGADPVSIGS